MTVADLISELRHLDPNAEIIIDLEAEDIFSKMTIERASPGDEGEVLINVINA